MYCKKVSRETEKKLAKVEKTDEELATEARKREDSFYGCDEEGRPGPEFMFMDLNEIGAQYKEVQKKYIIQDIEQLKNRISIRILMAAWRNTGKSEWEFMMGYMLVRELRKAWKQGQSEADITRLFQLELLAWPTEDVNEKRITINGNTYRVFDQEDVKNKVMPFFTILKEDEKCIYLKLNM